jgi:hypothetical protein
MFRIKAPALVVLLGSVGTAIAIVTPSLVHAAVGDFSGSIVPDICNCAGSGIANGASWGCVLLVVGNLIKFVIYLGATAAVAAIAYAGWLWVVNPLSPEGLSKAKGILTNAGIGLVITLAAWLIVNTVFSTFTTLTLSGVTSSLTGTSGNCLANAVDPAGIAGGTTSGINATGTPTGALPPTQSGPGSCDPSTVSAGATAGGYSLSSSQSQTLACIAKAESGCGANINQPASSAGGAWQVLMQTNSACYDNPACESAVGATGPLNCKNGFSGGKSLGNSTSQQCYQAAANVNCGAASAACLVKQGGANGGFQPWLTAPDHTKQQACVTQYAGG